MVDVVVLVADLGAESAELDRLVSDLDGPTWTRATPAAGWTVAHQIAHLAWTDEAALAAVTDEPAFRRDHLAPATHAFAQGRSVIDEAAAAGAGDPALLGRWRTARTALATALTAHAGGPDARPVPWFGPPMSVASFVTARIMETWAHGQDVADALGVRRTPSHRLRHVAHLGVRTRDFAYAGRGLPAPAEPFRVELSAPDGDVWAWGPADAGQRVEGPAEDFCLLVTRRRHLADTALVPTGPDAATWLTIAQAFAGPPGADRPASSDRSVSG